ncbi:MAG: hypothetical protein HRT65_00600 [Flavobacteriaceae bacterium]|nr:hypothetical protein [Flavobacteriaceae bacterium]
MKIKTNPDKRSSFSVRIPKSALGKPDFKKMNLGVLIGLIGGAGGTMGFGYVHDQLAAEDESESDTEIEEVELDEDSESVIYEIPTSVEFADSVNDAMSFEEAFKSAREELGQGGFFTWKGQHFHTYTAEEWDAFSEADKTKFFESFREQTDFDAGREVDTDDTDGHGADEVEPYEPDRKKNGEDERSEDHEEERTETDEENELVDLEELGSDEDIIDGLNDGEAFEEEDNYGQDIT